MGGAVKSAGAGTLASPVLSPTRRIYGTYPSFVSQINLPAYPSSSISDGTSGRLIPQTSTDRYFEELLKWFGLNSTDIGDVLPHLGNFSGQPALDFLV
jgi:hypothetical protein